MFQEQENDENRNYMLHHNSDNRDQSGGGSSTSAMAWPLLSYSVFSLYHWLFLQSIGQFTSQLLYVLITLEQKYDEPHLTLTWT